MPTEDTESEPTDVLPANEEWRIARLYLNCLGDISNLFTGCSRSLVHCAEHENGKLSKLASAKLIRLLGSPTMLAQIFYAAKTYYKSDLTSRASVEPGDFVFFISPYEFALLITIGYSTRRLSKIIDPQDWKLISDSYQLYADLAIPLGFAFPTIGPSRALMTACGRFLGWGLFNIKDPQNFKKYRVANKVQNRDYSLSEELKLFGTTHLHIASLIWQRFGFGIHSCEDYFHGLAETSDSEISSGAKKFRVASSWLRSLLEQGKPPPSSSEEDYALEDSASEKLIETYNSIKNNASEFKWLSRSRDDISAEKTPELIADYSKMTKAIKKPGIKAETEEKNR